MAELTDEARLRVFRRIVDRFHCTTPAGERSFYLGRAPCDGFSLGLAFSPLLRAAVALNLLPLAQAEVWRMFSRAYDPPTDTVEPEVVELLVGLGVVRVTGSEPGRLRVKRAM